MGPSSLESGFRFESFKVDKFNFHSVPNLGFLGFNENIPVHAWEYKLRFRNPLYFKADNLYVGGLEISLSLPSTNKEEETSEDSEKEPLVSLEAGISGIFKCNNEKRFERDIEESLVRVQIPALLLPYLRATITSVLASAGFGTVILPLINIHAAAKDALSKVEIQVIE